MKNDNESPKRKKCDFSCPCGGGQSCPVSRRSLGDYVLEDEVFKKNKWPLRKDCSVPFTKEQLAAMDAEFGEYDSLCA